MSDRSDSDGLDLFGDSNVDDGPRRLVPLAAGDAGDRHPRLQVVTSFAGRQVRKRAMSCRRPSRRQVSAGHARSVKQKLFTKRCKTHVAEAVRTAYLAGNAHSLSRARGRKLTVNRTTFSVSCSVEGSRPGPLTTAQRLTLMFESMSNDRKVALRLGVDEKTVRRLKAFGAACIMATQADMLEQMRGPHNSMDAFAQRLCWDETKYSVAISPASLGLSPQQCAASWNILVQKRRFLALPRHAADPSYMTIVVPPAYLSSTGGAYVFTGLFSHTPLVKDLNKFCVDMTEAAEYTFLALGCDGASANEKLIAHIINITEQPEGRQRTGGFECVSATLCGNHRVNLVEASAFCYINEKLHGDMFCAALVLASTGMFMRICLAAKVLASRAELRRCPSPIGAVVGEDFKVEFIQLLLDAKMSEWEHARLMPAAPHTRPWPPPGRQQPDGELPLEIDLREWHRRAKDGDSMESLRSSADPRLGAALLQYACALLLFILCFNSCWASPVWAHNCESAACCRGYDPEAMQTKMARLVTTVILTNMPNTPEKGKWTKTWPCVVWFLRAVCPHQMLRELLLVGGLRQTAQAEVQTECDSVRSGLVVDFAAIKGMRKARTLEFIGKPNTQHNIIVLCLLVEPLRFLCAWFMQASSSTHGGKRRFPPAFDLASPLSSPVAAMLRHYAALVRGASSRCVLVWGFCHESMEAWSSTFPERHAAVRRSILGLLAWLAMRFNFWKHWPFRLLQTGDARLDKDHRAMVARRFMHSCMDCLDQGCGRRLRRKVHSTGDLAELVWTRAMLVWGHQIPVSIADVEHTHSSNNVVGGTSRPGGGGFACRAFLKDCRLLAKSFADWAQHAAGKASGQAAIASHRSQRTTATLEESLSACKRALSPLDVFRKSKSIAGTLRCKVSAEANSALIEEFSRLPAQAKQEFLDLAMHTKQIAKRNRSQRSSDVADDPDARPRHAPRTPCDVESRGAPSVGRVLPRVADEGMQHQAIGDVWLQMSGRVDDGCRLAAITPMLPTSRHAQADSPAKELPPDVYSPMAHEVLEAYHRSVLREGGSIAQIQRQVYSRFDAFCRGEPGLSGRIAYPRVCGALCRDPAVTHESITKMRDDLSTSLSKVVRSLGGMKSLIESELMFCMISSCRGGTVQVRFFTVGACLAQTGSHLAAEVFLESSLLDGVGQVGSDLNPEGIGRNLQGKRLKLASAQDHELEITPRLPRVFRESQCASEVVHYTGDELVADLLSAKPFSVVAQRLQVQSTIGSWDVVDVVKCLDDRIEVAIDRVPVVFPVKETKAKKSGEVDLFRDVSTQHAPAQPSSDSSQVGGLSHDDRHTDQHAFGDLCKLLQDMMGFSLDDPLMVQLRECEKTLLDAEAEASREGEAAPEEDGEEEQQVDAPAVDEQPEQVDAEVGERQETLDEVMQRLGVVLDGDNFYKPGGPTDPSGRVRLGKINSLRRNGVVHALQAACAQGHKTCRLIIDLHKCETRLELETILLQWLAEGSTMSEQAHYASGMRLRQAFGYAVKR